MKNSKEIFKEMSDLHPSEEEDIAFVIDYDRKIHSFEWRIDADKANKAFLDEFFSPLHTVGTELQKAMGKFRSTLRDIELGYDDHTLSGHAYNARLWIEDALDRGIIIQGDGLTGKLENCERERTKIQNEHTELSSKFTEVDEQNKRLKDEVAMLRKKLYEKEGKR